MHVHSYVYLYMYIIIHKIIYNCIYIHMYECICMYVYITSFNPHNSSLHVIEKEIDKSRKFPKIENL